MIINPKIQHEQGDRLGRLLAWLVNREKGGNAVVAIKYADGTILTAQEDILQYFAEFYSGLCATRPKRHIIGLLDEVQLPRVEDAEREALNTVIDEPDARSAIKQMSTGKASGNDVPQVEFYQEYAELLCAPLLEMFKEAFKTGVLPESLREACIVVLQKSGRDPTECESDHPLLLLNIDAKILGKILSQCLAMVVRNIIRLGQAGFVGGSMTTTYIRKALLIMEQIEKGKNLHTGHPGCSQGL
ncbi:hypothetical protein NDU88_001590 [Pleurodeles waltl]|uniref:Reverse transcriptase domain-containing protein n=1 Tax=Pleurodeles waltl TaxID=8319 RepID=A0AAV7KWN3_PLEWA|nr:hypothetical protein NDU88_001590 [Pleurodeles waltl]